MENYGFIYIWRDKKHDRYYVGSHWGTEDDGYVCSSVHMKRAYERRIQDFKRRIIERFKDRSKINEIEHRWLQMMKPEELKGVRYYNQRNHRFGNWSINENNLDVKAKISKTLTGQKQSEETKAKRAVSMKKAWEEGRMKGMTGKTHSDEYRTRLSKEKKGVSLVGKHLENMRAANAKRTGVPTGRSSERQKAAVSAKLREMWQDPEYRAKMSAFSRRKKTERINIS